MINFTFRLKRKSFPLKKEFVLPSKGISFESLKVFVTLHIRYTLFQASLFEKHFPFSHKTSAAITKHRTKKN